MIRVPFLPPPTPAEYDRLVCKLLREPALRRPKQHVVSRVLVDRFAEPSGAKGERQSAYLNRRYPKAKLGLVGAEGCGKFLHFVKYASESSEATWKMTEDRMRPALEAAEDGTFYDAREHAGTVRDAVVLHLVRSIPSLINSDRTWKTEHAQHVQRWMTVGRADLARLHRERYRRPATSEADLRVMAEDLIGGLSTQMHTGIYFRVTLVERFQRFSRMLAKQPVEIRRATDGELLIGDVPALILGGGLAGMWLNAGTFICDEIVLPLGPKVVAVLGAGNGYTSMDRTAVDRLNTLQVRAAADHVYMRPGSSLETFARAAVTPVHPNRIPDHLRQQIIPSTFRGSC